MLISLHIENIAVIRSVDIDFEREFSVMTGETGAGKSIIIDSIGLVLGDKFSKELIRTGQSRASVSALFGELPENVLTALDALGLSADEDGCVFIQRSVSADGRSVTKYNGRAIPLSLQREVGSLLINIHGQHDSRALLDPGAHISYLDKFAHNDGLLCEYRKFYDAMLDARRRADAIKKDEREKQQRIDMLKFQINDIESAKLKADEEEKLRAEKNVLVNAKQISKQINTLYRALYKNEKGMSAYRLIEIARKSLNDIADLVPNARAFSDKLYDMQYELSSIADAAYSVLPRDCDDPETALSKIEDRLDTIHKLERKYGASVSEVLDFLDKAKKELGEIMVSDEKIKEYGLIFEKNRKSALEVADKLSKKRIEAAETLSCGVCSILEYLDMKKVIFRVGVKSRREEDGLLCPTGADEVEFLISTNPGEPLKPLAKIASGGEMSRIMLAIKCVLTNAEGIPTVIFDEIDTGVSGKTSQKIGIKLHDLSKYMQVISITHSAQVSANADRHLKIEKHEIDGMSETTVRDLDISERADELARIMGGVTPSEKIYESAVEMLKNAGHDA